MREPTDERIGADEARLVAVLDRSLRDGNAEMRPPRAARPAHQGPGGEVKNEQLDNRSKPGSNVDQG